MAVTKEYERTKDKIPRALLLRRPFSFYFNGFCTDFCIRKVDKLEFLELLSSSSVHRGNGKKTCDSNPTGGATVKKLVFSIPPGRATARQLQICLTIRHIGILITFCTVYNVDFRNYFSKMHLYRIL